MKLLRVGTWICGCILLTSCANLSSVHRTLDTKDGTGVLIDIKQRGILASYDKNRKDGFIVCAEPSPDALSAYASSLLAKGELPKGSGALGAALSEGAAFTGLRTQSIQLLRDSFYRICEAYMNGAVSAGQYDLLMRRYQKHTVALLAVEQLTGTVRAPAVVINTEAKAPSPEALVAQDTIARNNKSIEGLEADKEKATTAKDDAKVKELDKSIEALKAQNADLEKSVDLTKGGQIQAKAQGGIESTGGASPDRTAVSAAVKDIVEGVTQVDDFLQLCMIHIATQAEKEAKADKAATGIHAIKGIAWSESMAYDPQTLEKLDKVNAGSPSPPALTYSQLYTGLCRQRIEAATWHSLADLEVKKELTAILRNPSATNEMKTEALGGLKFVSRGPRSDAMIRSSEPNNTRTLRAPFPASK